MDPNYYPAFVNLKGKRCIVVGGGRVAERKVLSLLRSGASVAVISPSLTPCLARKRDRGIIDHIAREYRQGDANTAFLVIAATGDERVNREVSEDAPCMINVVDQPGLANFIVPSVVRRGPLTIAVSTAGTSPALARAIRSELEQMYGDEIGQFLRFLGGLRKKAMSEVTDKKSREQFLRAAASGDLLRILREKGLDAAKRAVAGSAAVPVRKPGKRS